jgi:hypothetical protein
MSDERVLWTATVPDGTLECVMISCCAGAELQLRKHAAAGADHVLVRELYPTKSDLYERARMLADEYQPR